MQDQRELQKCWVCGASDFKLFKASNIAAPMKSESFAITDSSYGVTTELLKCQQCGFVQSSGLNDVLDFYENLEDPAYEVNRKERSLQALKIVSKIKNFTTARKLLDIGAGSGMLVEQAIKQGFDATGVEPSKWLYSKAVEYKLPVELGIFPHPNIRGLFDVITLVDVIEHVNNPVELLQNINAQLVKDGIVVVVTPNVKSIAARVLKHKWWHFRIAHIGYFDKKTLDLALKKSGFLKVYATSAKWYFAFDYLLKRVNTYLPKFINLPIPRFTQRVTLPINLFDSIFVIYKKK